MNLKSIIKSIAFEALVLRVRTYEAINILINADSSRCISSVIRFSKGRSFWRCSHDGTTSRVNNIFKTFTLSDLISPIRELHYIYFKLWAISHL